MPIPTFLVDAFTPGPFGGGPAAVCLLGGPAPTAWMRDVARELAQPVTAFLYRSGGVYRLRWFNSHGESKLCGHATLAGAHILFEHGFATPDETLRFATLAGELRARRSATGLVLDLPADPPSRVRPSTTLRRAVPGNTVFVGRGRLDQVVEVASAHRVRSLEPDHAAIGKLPARGLIVTAHGDRPGVDYVFRFFAPRVGLPEDPATGSAQCVLGPYWGKKLGKGTLRGCQPSARGASFEVRLDGDRVGVGGSAVTVLSGTLPDPNR